MTLRLTRTYGAPRDAVFRAWTDPEALRRWWVPFPGMSVPAVEVDLRPGGRYRITMRNTKGELLHVTGVYREVVPPERLVYTWRWEGTEHLDGVETVVTIELVERGRGTELRLTHDGFPETKIRDRHAAGWNGILDRLAQELGAASDEAHR